MLVELKIPIDLYSEDKEGKEKLVKRNVITRQYIDTEEIRNPQEVFNTKGNVIKNRCKILLLNVGQVLINHSYESIKSLKEETSIKIPKVKGFLAGIKKKNKQKEDGKRSTGIERSF